MEKELLLSIIIPAYNLENYIGKTIESCLNQNIPTQSYEILCIDDGSSDNTLNCLNKYSEKYNNIRVLTQENKGVSATRNRGIKEAKGKYIWFVDGDDIIRQNCLKELLNEAVFTDADKLLFGMQSFKKDFTIFDESFTFSVCKERDKLYEFMFTHTGGGVCRALYKAKLLKDNALEFNTNIAYSEDTLFDWQVLLNAKVCAKTETICYFYRQREGSAMHSNNLEKHGKSMYLLAKEYNKIAKNIKEDTWRALGERKRNFAVKALLFTAVRSGEAKEAKKLIKLLKTDGLYPYPFLNIIFNNKTKKEFLINTFSYLFPLQWYFFICVRCFWLKNKLIRK